MRRTAQRTADTRDMEIEMVYYTFILLLVGLMAGFLGLAGVLEVAVEIAAVLFVIEMVLELVIHLTERRTGEVS